MKRLLLAMFFVLSCNANLNKEDISNSIKRALPGHNVVFDAQNHCLIGLNRVLPIGGMCLSTKFFKTEILSYIDAYGNITMVLPPEIIEEIMKQDGGWSSGKQNT